MAQSISEIKEIFQAADIMKLPELIKDYKEDNRAGVQKLIESANKKLLALDKEKERIFKMKAYEREYEALGYVCGIDEVGRGPLAGPVVAAAVILPEDFYLPGLNDSKQLSAQRREEYFQSIHEQAVAVSTGIIHSKEIDEINIYEAAKKAMLKAISQLEVSPDYCLIDAMEVPLPIEQLSLIKGDAKSVSIAAASVIAKETRDRMMKEYANQHPEYGFEKHMGYGTKSHLEAIERFGPTDWHRMTFAPLKAKQ